MRSSAMRGYCTQAAPAIDLQASDSTEGRQLAPDGSKVVSALEAANVRRAVHAYPARSGRRLLSRRPWPHSAQSRPRVRAISNLCTSNSGPCDCIGSDAMTRLRQ